MKTYIVTTGALFGLVTALHVWRATLEWQHLSRDPFWLGITATAAALCVWACVLLARARGRGGAPPVA